MASMPKLAGDGSLPASLTCTGCTQAAFDTFKADNAMLAANPHVQDAISQQCGASFLSKHLASSCFVNSLSSIYSCATALGRRRRYRIRCTHRLHRRFIGQELCPLGSVDDVIFPRPDSTIHPARSYVRVRFMEDTTVVFLTWTILLLSSRPVHIIHVYLPGACLDDSGKSS